MTQSYAMFYTYWQKTPNSAVINFAIYRRCYSSFRPFNHFDQLLWSLVLPITIDVDIF